MEILENNPRASSNNCGNASAKERFTSTCRGSARFENAAVAFLPAFPVFSAAEIFRI
jgi:hypothetical protein